MLKNPEIILLDEPTSALDSYNEEQVTIALNNLFKDKTVIVIAHRLQTVKHADEIIYIGRRDALHASDHGNISANTTSQILERGTHEELLAKKGEYYKMVELQSGF
jgi:ABC-type multidrug transport system fused ATPase/permease subunit